VRVRAAVRAAPAAAPARRHARTHRGRCAYRRVRQRALPARRPARADEPHRHARLARTRHHRWCWPSSSCARSWGTAQRWGVALALVAVVLLSRG
jgi:hypothetical protein